MLKKYIIAAMISVLALAMTAGTSFAVEKEKLTVVITGSANGTFNMTTRLFNEHLKTVYDVTLINGDGCTAGFNAINGITDTPVLFLSAADDMAAFESGKNIACGLALTREEFLVTAWVNTHVVCTGKDSGLTWKTFSNPNVAKATLGTDRGLYKIRNTLNEYFGNTFKWVPYNGSGSLYRGMVAGDVDYILINSLRAHKGHASGNFVCLLDSDKMSTSSDVSVQLRNYTPWFVRNVTPEQKDTLLRHVQDAMETPALQQYYNTGAIKATETPDEQYKIFQDSILDWTINLE